MVKKSFLFVMLIMLSVSGVGITNTDQRGTELKQHELTAKADLTFS